MFRRCRKFLLIALLPLLAACVNDGASYQIDGPQHSISVVRMQPHFWEERVDLHLVAQRMPESQRRYVIETRTCTGPV